MKKYFFLLIIILFSIGWVINRDMISPPVDVGNKIENIMVNVYFSNTTKDPQMLDCSKVYPVQREIKNLDLEERIKLALTELLKGPTDAEMQTGYITSLNNGVEINYILVNQIESGEDVVMIDFNTQFNYQMGGSCRVENIRSQIRNTVVQFPEFDELTAVKISVDGVKEGVLEP